MKTADEGESIRKGKDLFDYYLETNDIIKLHAGNNTYQMRVVYKNGKYLAHKYHYNGVERYFYPLGKDFVWAYAAVNHFQNYGTPELKDSILRNRCRCTRQNLGNG